MLKCPLWEMETAQTIGATRFKARILCPGRQKSNQNSGLFPCSSSGCFSHVDDGIYQGFFASAGLNLQSWSQPCLPLLLLGGRGLLLWSHTCDRIEVQIDAPLRSAWFSRLARWIGWLGSTDVPSGIGSLGGFGCRRCWSRCRAENL